MTPKQAGKRLTDLGPAVTDAVMGGLRSEQTRAIGFGIEQTSGTHSADELQEIAKARGAGVYSVRRPDRRFAADKANIRSGQLVRGWNRGALYMDSAGTLHGPVNNTSPHARWFDGEQHGAMVARDVGGAVAKRVAKGFYDRIAKIVNRVLK
jgi:hypothetical protein